MLKNLFVVHCFSMDKECHTCNGSIERFVFETKYWRVNLADEQSYLGRCFVDLKSHKGDLAELNSGEWADFVLLVKTLEAKCRKAFGASMFNWTCLMNNAFRKKPWNPHVHWHFRPRYEKPVKFAGLVFSDPDFGEHYDRARDLKLDAEKARLVIEAIKKA